MGFVKVFIRSVSPGNIQSESMTIGPAVGGGLGALEAEVDFISIRFRCKNDMIVGWLSSFAFFGDGSSS